ncbi:MAG TPA: twin-arginine translocation pathway signal protein, partial [Hyphomicrobiales bacterium]|nr:twin-arginine translocation pathway signal protein [Hyphomicrobiales bacterium]
HLAATLAGLAFHPLSQALEEYPEMAGPYREVHDLLAPPGHTVQMLVRLGYAPAVAPSPRWPLAERMVGA